MIHQPFIVEGGMIKGLYETSTVYGKRGKTKLLNKILLHLRVKEERLNKTIVWLFPRLYRNGRRGSSEDTMPV